MGVVSRSLHVTLLAGLSACAGAAAAPVTAPTPSTEAKGSGPKPSATKRHLLAGCEQSKSDAGLALNCGEFLAILSRLTSKDPVDHAIVAKVESDLVAGMKTAIRGDFAKREVVIPTPGGSQPAIGFTVSRSGQLVLHGTVMAAALNEREVLAVTCFTKLTESQVCTQVMKQVLTRGLPDLRAPSP